MVKSIIKALVGEYTIYSHEQEEEIRKFYKKYAQNIVSALYIYYPQGLVGSDKLFDILCAIGAEPSQDQFDFLLSRMANNSHSLEELNYDDFFSQL